MLMSNRPLLWGAFRQRSAPRLALVAILVGFAVSAVSTSLGQEAESDPRVELVLGLLNDSDKDIRALAFEQIRTDIPGAAATEQFAAQLSKLPIDSQVGLLRALAARGDAAARPAVLEQIKHTDVTVRLAAIEAIGDLGSVEDLDPLFNLLQQGSSEEKTAARRSIERVSGDGVSKAIAGRLKNADLALQVVLIEVLKERRAFDTAVDILPFAIAADAAVRKTAMVTLGELGNGEQIEGMVRGVLRAERGAERAAAEKAVMFVCQRLEPRDAGAKLIVSTATSLSSKDKIVLLSLLGRVGGEVALAEVERAISSNDTATRTAGINALTNWPDVSVAPRLIELAKSKEFQNQRTNLVRALIRVSVLADARTDDERLSLLKQAMEMCQRPDDRRLAIQRASAIRSVESLRFVLPLVDQPDYSLQACESICELAHHRALREQHKSEFHAALDKVIAVCKDPVIVDRANRYKNNQTWVRPK